MLLHVARFLIVIDAFDVFLLNNLGCCCNFIAELVRTRAILYLNFENDRDNYLSARRECLQCFRQQLDK